MKEIFRRVLVVWYSLSIVGLLGLIPVLWFEFSPGAGSENDVALKGAVAFALMAGLVGYALAKVILPSNSTLVVEGTGIEEWLYLLLLPVGALTGASVTLMVNLAHHGGSRGLIESFASGNLFSASVFSTLVTLLVPLLVVLPVALVKWIFAGSAK